MIYRTQFVCLCFVYRVLDSTSTQNLQNNSCVID